MPSDPVIIYIVGAGRSGSTLLERMLGSLNGFHNVGELVEIYHRGIMADEDCSCGRPFSACDFWIEVGKRAFDGWSPDQAEKVDALRWKVQPRKHLPRTITEIMRDRGAVHDYVRYFEPLPAAIAEVAQAGVIVDASKLVTQALALSSSPKLDVRLLHLVRDPRGVAYSWQKADVVRPAAKGDFTRMRTHPAGLSAARWTVDNALAEAAGKRTGRYHRMRYEDLMVDPVGEVTTALEALGVDSPENTVAQLSGRSLSLGAGHALLGNPSGYGRPVVTLREDIAWHDGLSPRDRRIVTGISGPMLLRYRYPGKIRTTTNREESDQQ